MGLNHADKNVRKCYFSLLFFSADVQRNVNVRGIRTGKIRRNSDFSVSLELKYGIGNDQE